jgi:hypothetical protein
LIRQEEHYEEIIARLSQSELERCTLPSIIRTSYQRSDLGLYRHAAE